MTETWATRRLAARSRLCTALLNSRDMAERASAAEARFDEAYQISSLASMEAARADSELEAARADFVAITEECL